MTQILAPLAKWKFWKELLIMTLGMLIASSAVYYFMMPGKLVLGSISGLSIVITHVMNGMGIAVRLSWVVAAINAILLILAWLLIGAEFGAKTVYTAMILAPMLDFWEWLCPYEKLVTVGPTCTSLMGDPWLDLVCFVLIVSLSQTILFSINASTGGLDILAKIVNKYLHFDIGASVTVAGGIICCSAFAINPFRMVIIGLLGTWINGIAIDYFTASFNRKKRVCIISKDYEQIHTFIIEQLHRGCSLYEVTGGFTGEKSQEIQALLTKDEFSSLMKFIKDNGITSFVTAGNVSEIYGTWNDKREARHRKH